MFKDSLGEKSNIKSMSDNFTQANSECEIRCVYGERADCCLTSTSTNLKGDQCEDCDGIKHKNKYPTADRKNKRT